LRSEAAALDLEMPTDAVPQLIKAHASDVAEAASRLAAAPGAAGAAATPAEASGEEAGSGEEAAAGGEATASATSEEGAATTTAEGEFTPEELAIYEREYAELLAAEGVTEVPVE
jgi:hypothetical protein